MINVTLYVEKDCAACDEAAAALESMQTDAPHRLVKIDVASDRTLAERFAGRLPVVEIGPYQLKSPFTTQELQVMLFAARDRVNQLEKIDQQSYQKLVAKGQTLSSGDKLSFWISKHYLLVVMAFLVLYTGLPFVAPVLMKINAPAAAAIIYRIYSPMCHQLAFRSFFLFGEQAYYPRSLAEIPNVTTYEQLMNQDEIDLLLARNFVGNEIVGYKVALCQRDVAIYGVMVLFGIFFALVGRRVWTIPWYVWVILGLGPIGLDGFSQLPSFASGLPSWMIIRESTPLLRAITGAMFGWMTAWYLFPMIEETLRETRRIMQRKQAVIQQARADRAG